MAKNSLSGESLIYFIARRAKISYAQATLVLEQLAQVLTSTLKTGESIELVGFGKFEIRNHAARTATIPATTKIIQVPAKKVPVFIPGKRLKAAICQNA